RQIELDRGALADLAVDLDMAAGLLDEAIDLAEAEARAASLGLGREERLEGARDDVRAPAAAGVADAAHAVLARGDLAVLRGIGVVEEGVGDLDGELAAVRHRVARVDGEIEQRALELARIDEGIPQPARDDALDVDAFAEGAAQEIGHVLD